MKIDLMQVPFSRFGSYFAISEQVLPGRSEKGLFLRSVHGGNSGYQRPAIQFELLVNEMHVPYQVSAAPSVLRLSAHQAGKDAIPHVKICMPEPNQLRIRGRGAGLRMRFEPGPYDSLFPASAYSWQFICASWDLNMILTVLTGKFGVDAPWQVTRASHILIDLLPGENGECEAVIEELDRIWNPHEFSQSFDEGCQDVQTEFERWLDQTPELPEVYAPLREQAAYVTWASVVDPFGHIDWPAMLMSKNWMSNVWSWDHCFNAMALTYHNPILAWEQLRVVFDQQDRYGGLPDSINDRTIVHSFVKPPIHGWAINWMMDRTNFIRKEQLNQIYGPLCHWTEWWFQYRDYDQDGIPQYHHGNDSGWDNATIFDAGMPLESPDLCAYLALQMETLGRMAERLGNIEESESWQRRGKELIEQMLAHFWQGDHFVAMRSGDHLVSDTDSLLLYLPLILGKRLPYSVQRDLVAGLMRPGRFLSPYGLATESLQSPHYEPDGYWRGPIWAPSTLLAVEGLAASGLVTLAEDVAQRFCDLCARSGFAENFDAQSGEGLRDRAYTWTASVFLILGHEYLLKKG